MEPFEYVWEYAGVQYLIGTVLIIEIDQFKKNSPRAHRAPAARENVFHSFWFRVTKLLSMHLVVYT